MEAKTEEFKTTDVTITVKDDIGGFGFSFCQMVGGQLVIMGEDPINRKNFDSVYAVLSEVNKKAVDNYIKYIKANPAFIEAARAKAKEEDEAKIKKYASENANKKGGVN